MLGVKRLRYLRAAGLLAGLFVITAWAQGQTPGASAHPQRAAREPLIVVYPDTSRLTCPGDQALQYFYHASDVPARRAASWCGAALADVNWANANDPVIEHLPYTLESCEPGVAWYYSHQSPSDTSSEPTRYYAPASRNISMVCLKPFTSDGCAAGPGGFADCPPPGSERGAPPALEDANQNSGEPPRTDPVVIPDTEQTSCRAPKSPAEPPPPSPPDSAGNPIFTGTGNKYQREQDYSGPGDLQIVRHYNSAMKGWVHNYLMRLTFWGASAAAPATIAAVRPDGRLIVYTGSGAGTWSANATVVERLIPLTPVAPGDPAWKLITADDTVELYDAAGLPLSITYRGGRTLTLSYTGGLLQTVTDAFGRALSYSYDTQQRLVGITAPGAQTFAYGYDADGHLAQVTYADASTRQYRYENPDFPHALTGLIDESGTRYASWTYDSQGRATSSEHAGGVQRHTVQYDHPGGAVQVTDPLGTQRLLAHQNVAGKKVLATSALPCANCSGDTAGNTVNAQGRVTQKTDFLGVPTNYSWDDARGLLTGITRAAGLPEAQSLTLQWHTQYRLPVQINEAGRTTTTDYDSAGNPVYSTVLDTASGRAATVAMEWTNGLLTAQTDPLGRTTRYQYDSAGNLTRATNAAGHVTQYSYDTAGRVTSAITPMGAVIANSYDARGRLTSRSVTPAGGGAAEVDSFSWRHTGQLAGASLANGVAFSYSYDDAQRLTQVTDHLGNAVAYALDAMGNRISTTYLDANGAPQRVRNTRFNELNRVNLITDASNRQLLYIERDANGEITLTSDALAQRTSTTLDALRRPVATQFADGATANLGYNNLDQLTSATDPKGVQTAYTVDALGHVRATTSPDAGASSADYDAAGNLTSVTNALNQTTQYQYDSLNRITRITWADGQQANFTYDGAANAITNGIGKLTRIEDPQGTTSYAYDGFGRLAAKTQALKNGASHTVGYAYSAGGDLASITYPSGKVVAYTRQGGRVTGISIDGVPFVSDVSYTGLNAPKAWNWASGDSASRTFDNDARLATSELASYTYDAAGRITAMAQNLYLPTGTDTFALGASNYRVDYDSRNRITRMQRDMPAPPAPDPQQQQRPKDPGQSSQVQPLRAAAADNPNAPTARFAESEAFSYDANGNRIAKTEVLRLINPTTGTLTTALTTQRDSRLEEASNRLLGFDQTITQSNARGVVQSSASLGVDYALDAAGNQLGDGLKQYEHDASGRLAKLSYLKSGTRMSVLYLHNAQGQRVFKSEPMADDPAPDPATTAPSFIDWLHTRFAWLFGTTRRNDRTKLGTAFVYEGTDLLGEYGTGGANSTGSTEYIYLPTDGGNILVGAIINGEKYAIHTDHLNTPRRMTDAANQPVWQWSYSAFGDNEPSVAARNFKDRSWAFAKGDLTDLQDGVDNADNGPAFGKKMIKLNLRYPGQYFDDESNLHFNGFRTYDSRTGRYTQGDPIGLSGGGNRFAHAESNPLSYSDPSGLNPFFVFFAFGWAANEIANSDVPILGGSLAKAAVKTGEACLAANGLTKADAIIAETLAGKGNITSAAKLSADDLLQAGEKFLGSGYKEIGRPGSGVFRSTDGTRQFRMDSGSLTGSHKPGVPHGHLEVYTPGAPKPIVNNHIPFFD